MHLFAISFNGYKTSTSSKIQRRKTTKTAFTSKASQTTLAWRRSHWSTSPIRVTCRCTVDLITRTSWPTTIVSGSISCHRSVPATIPLTKFNLMDIWKIGIRRHCNMSKMEVPTSFRLSIWSRLKISFVRRETDCRMLLDSMSGQTAILTRAQSTCNTTIQILASSQPYQETSPSTITTQPTPPATMPAQSCQAQFRITYRGANTKIAKSTKPSAVEPE